MSAVERLEAAIAKLEQLRAESSSGPWTAWRVGPPLGGAFGLEDSSGEDILFGRFDSQRDVELVEMLHRIMEPALEIMRNGDMDSFLLVDAILGSES